MNPLLLACALITSSILLKPAIAAEKSMPENRRAEMHEQLRKKRAQVREACQSDFEKFCKDMHGPHNRLNCLKDHQNQLSSSCKHVFPTR